MKRFAYFAAVAARVAGFCGTASGAVPDSVLIINGSTTILPFAQIAAERFMTARPDVKISLSGGGSGNGIKALIDKTAAIANSSRPIKQGEIDQAKAGGVEPFATVVALDCIVPIVNPVNGVTELSREQLKKIYTGEVTNWKDVGGENQPIAIVGRDTSSGTYGTWQELVIDWGGGEKKRVTPRTQVAASSGAMIAMVAGNKYAIGYDGIGYLDKTVKSLKVEGVEASEKTAKNGTYPLGRELYMYTNDRPVGAAAAFIEYILSADGQKIVSESGFIPLDR
jgi:phosphate transport system substrate-binding protein